MKIQPGKENKHSIAQHFSYNDYGFADLPTKIGNVKLSRFLNGDLMGCQSTFPHGVDNYNQAKYDCRKSWKKYRKTQWRLQSGNSPISCNTLLFWALFIAIRFNRE